MSLIWAPTDYRMGDPRILCVGDEYHFFTEATPLQAPPGETIRGPVIVLHYRSRNLVDWEPLPPCFTTGAPGTFDAHLIYHMDVNVFDGMWYMHYTGLDKPGPGQAQAIGLATSRDGITWKRHSQDPVLRCDPRFYEQAIPPEATYQKKDGGRMWFRDPCIIRDPKSGKFGMAVMARDLNVDTDVRGCVSWALSDDLIHWQEQGPIYSPQRFHTIECPAIFEHEGRHYLFILTHPAWGVPYMTTDPYQNAGAFYAISDDGPAGPYRAPRDEVLMAAADRPRLGTQRLLRMADGSINWYGELFTRPGHADGEARFAATALPTFKPVRFVDDRIEILFPPYILRYTKEGPIDPSTRPALSRGWRQTPGGVAGKNFAGRASALFPADARNFIFSTTIQFHAGECAGIVARAKPDASAGWQIVLDRRLRRVEFTLLEGIAETPENPAANETLGDTFGGAGNARRGDQSFIDARGWNPTDSAELKIVADEISLEVYVNDRLMLNVVRHREISGHVGYLVERCHAEFTNPRLLTLTR